MASLAGRSLQVLLQSCPGWWDQLYILLFCEYCFLGIVNVLARTGSVREQHDEPLDGMHDIVWYATWCKGYIQQCGCNFWQNGPAGPGSLLNMSSKARCSVTPSQSVTHGECLALTAMSSEEGVSGLSIRSQNNLLPIPN